MQEEVTQKTIALSVKTARVTADVLKNMLRKYLSGQKQKGKNPYKVGKQSYKELKSQGSGLLHIAKLNGRICGAKRSHSVFEQPNCYQSSLCNLILIMIVAISGMVNTSF